jgi:hypothetical protein
MEHNAKAGPDRYPHLTGVQKGKIREVAARAYAAPEEGGNIPQHVADDIVSHWTIAECLSSFSDSDRRGLGFDPATGKRS